MAATHALVCGIAVGIVLANVAKPGSAEERIADRVEQDVGVRVAVEAFVEGNVDAADDELAAGDEPMHVKTLADLHAPARRARMASAIATSSG